MRASLPRLNEVTARPPTRIDAPAARRWEVLQQNKRIPGIPTAAEKVTGVGDREGKVPPTPDLIR